METTFTVTNMHCEACEKVIAMILKKLPSVTDVKVDRATGLVSLTSSEPLAQNDIIATLGAHNYSIEF